MLQLQPTDALPALEYAPHIPVLYCHLDIVERHHGTKALSRLMGWIVGAQGFEVVALGLRLRADTVLRCNFPFFRGDHREIIAAAGRKALTGFNLLLPARLALAPAKLEFVVMVARDNAAAEPYEFTLDFATGHTQRLNLTAHHKLPAIPTFASLPTEEIGPLLEERVFDRLASHRHLWLRLDLINKCNLRCVMCHYSNEDFAKRPVQRIAPEQFFAFFDPIAPIVRDVMLSCGDEPLMSPHFETIIRELAERDPEVRIRFCTNGMLLTEKVAAAIVAANVHHVSFSFDGVTSETLHRIRVGSDYRRIVKNILHLCRLRAQRGTDQPRFMFNFVMLESNIHEAPMFVHLARRLGADAIDFRHVVPFDFYDIEHEMLEFHQPKYNHYHARISEVARECGMKVFLPPPFVTEGRHDPATDPVCTLDEFHRLLFSLNESPLARSHTPAADDDRDERVLESAHFFCDRPFTEIMIREQRDVYPCPWHREKLGTLDGTTNLEEIFFGEKFRRLRLAMLDPHGAPGCAGCPIKADYLPVRASKR